MRAVRPSRIFSFPQPPLYISLQRHFPLVLRTPLCLFPLPPPAAKHSFQCYFLALLRRTLRSFLALLSYTNSALYFQRSVVVAPPSFPYKFQLCGIDHPSFLPQSTEPTPLGTYYRPIANCYYGQLVASDALTRFSLLFSYNVFAVNFKSLVFLFFSVAFSSTPGSSTWIVQGC